MIRAPANVLLLRAQVILILGALIPTILTTPLGVILLVTGDAGEVEIVTGVLVLAFAASSVTGFIIGGIFLRRGSALITVQHDFLSAASHELRTPMTAMRMFIEALLDDRLTDPQERVNCLRVVRQEMDRLDGLVDQLIQMSRLEVDANPYERRPVAVADVFRDSLSAFEAMQTLDQTQLKVELEDDLFVMGDRAGIAQVLVNLLSNAWKYSGDDKEIHCSAKAIGEKEVEIVVADNGPGIPSDEQKQVFEKFWRGRKAVESGTKGSGLGLAIVRGIVKAQRGRIELKTSAGGGTAVHVYLPRSKP